jgi:hypothetical protein
VLNYATLFQLVSGSPGLFELDDDLQNFSAKASVGFEQGLQRVVKRLTWNA